MSGNAFAAPGEKGIDEEHVGYITQEVIEALGVCPQMAIVVGGGNVMRGSNFCPRGKSRLRADHAGMLATVVNALILLDSLETRGTSASVYSGLPVTGAVAGFDADDAREDLKEGRAVILAGGTGNPLFTTDTAAALRGIQLDVDVILKATRVEGVFSSDPEQNDDSEFFEELSCQEILRRQLGVMDLCAISLCMEHDLPVRVGAAAADLS